MRLAPTFASWVFVIGLTACGGAATAPPAASPSAAGSPAPIAVDRSSEGAFTASAAAILRRAVPDARVDVTAPLTLRAQRAPKKDLQISLDRAWNACEAEPAACDATTRDYMTKTAALLTHEEAPATADRIVAVIRPATYLDAVPPATRANTITAPFVGDLLVVYMVDDPDSARTLTPDDLARLKVAHGELASLAARNLKARLAPIADGLAGTPGGSGAIVSTGSFYDSSRLLLGDEWAALAAQRNGTITVAVPASDAVFVVFDAAPDRLPALRKVVTDAYARAERPVSPDLFRWTDHGWEIVR